MYLYQGDQKISNCIIDNNKGHFAGAVCSKSKVQFYRVLMINSRFDTMIMSFSEINIINCTIAYNRSAFEIDHCDVNIINSIIWNDSPQINILCGDSNLPISHVIIAYSNIKGGINQIQGVTDSLYYENSNIDSDPLFRNIENGDYYLKENSPCINSGIAFFKMRNMELNLTEEDFRGSAPDMGAFESDDSPWIVCENTSANMSLSNYPNPFNSMTTIQFSLSLPGNVSLSIYSITGQRVIDLLKKTLPCGNYKIKWNGKDKLGNNISSGIYILQLNNEMYSLSKRLVYLK